MTDFEKLKQLFPYNWPTLYVGWRGVGVYSPWPNDWLRFPSLLSEEELLDCCYESVGREDVEMGSRIAGLVEMLNSDERSRGSVLECLAALSGSPGREQADAEMRKWRCACVANELDSFRGDNSFEASRNLEELFLEFGSLEGSPECMQRIGSEGNASMHYEPDKCESRIKHCRKWLETEIELLRTIGGGSRFESDRSYPGV